MTLNSFKWLYASIDWVMVMMMIKTIVWMRKIGMMVRYKQRWWWVFQGVVWRQEVLWVAFWRHHFLTGITNFGFPGSDRSSLCHRAKTQRRQDKKKNTKKTQRQKDRKKESLIWQICTLAMCGSIPPPIMFLLSTLMVNTFPLFYYWTLPLESQPCLESFTLFLLVMGDWHWVWIKWDFLKLSL